MYDFFKKIHRDGIMIKTKLGGIILIGSLLFAGCSSFIKDEDSDSITLKYQAGEYVLLQDINRNNVIFPKNSQVKLIVLTGDDWIKIYAYNSSEELLVSNRFLLLYMFEEDFPEKKFSQDYLNAELLKIVRPKGSADKAVKETKKTSNKVLKKETKKTK
jgi:type II secretion system-associated lipoprotein